MKTVTVSTLHRASGPTHNVAHSRVPSIRLTGNWLAHLGFTPGVKLIIRTKSGALRLEVVR